MKKAFLLIVFAIYALAGIKQANEFIPEDSQSTWDNAKNGSSQREVEDKLSLCGSE